jgi:predicted glycoside hydrolase/deacetylase ChbG (UPF0249 family)
MASRRLIVNADDLGQSPSINAGIRECAELGVVTSASLMVRWAAAEDAARWANTVSSLSLGLHLDLGEWVCVGGEWRQLYSVVDEHDPGAVRDEVDAQLDSFLRMAGRAPTHIDSHQHVHKEEPVRTLVLERAARLGVPVRGLSETVAYCGKFYGQWSDGTAYPDGVGYDALMRILDDLPDGTSELGCHPGTGERDVESMYWSERSAERDVLCDPRLPDAMTARGIELCSY